MKNPRLENHVRHLLREFKDLALDGGYGEAVLNRFVDRVVTLIDEEPLTRGQAAALLGVSLTTFDKYRKEGRFPEHYPYGEAKKWGRPRFFRSEITVNLNPSLPGFRVFDGGNP